MPSADRAPRSSNAGTIALTALAPLAWGTTYYVTTEALPPDRPILAAAARALPVAILLAIAVRRWPPSGGWWLRAVLLGVLNIGLFFPLLFAAAYRLPGGVAATIGAIQPLVVVMLAWPILAHRPERRRIVAGFLGIVGIALLVLRSTATLDAVGVFTALGASLSMALGIVLTKRWGRPAPLAAFTMWQLLFGGLALLPLGLLAEGPPPALTTTNIAGFAYIGAFGTGLAYMVWFRALERLPAPAVSFLGLISPLVATALGYLALGEVLTIPQLLGAALVFAAVALGSEWRS